MAGPGRHHYMHDSIIKTDDVRDIVFDNNLTIQYNFIKSKGSFH